MDTDISISVGRDIDPPHIVIKEIMFCVIIIKEMGLFKANEGREWKRKGNGVQDL